MTGWQTALERDRAWNAAWGYELWHLRLLAEREVSRRPISGAEAEAAILVRYRERRAALQRTHPEVPAETRPAGALRIPLSELLAL